MHIPYNLKQYRFFDIGFDHYYYDDLLTEETVSNVVVNSYMPLCKTLLEMINLSKYRFHCAITITGVTMELLEQYRPEMIDILKVLAGTSCVEFLVTPYSYSLASEFDKDEYINQLIKQKEAVNHLLGVNSNIVCNPEMVYSDTIGMLLQTNGFGGVLIEGAKHLLSWKSPNYVYSSVANNMPILTRNGDMSNELSFHFSDPQWTNYPIDAESYVSRIVNMPQEEQVVFISLGADTFGILQSQETGIFPFLLALPYYGLELGVSFSTPSQILNSNQPKEILSALHSMSWTGETKDLNSFIGNDLQQEVVSKLYSATEWVRLCQDNRLKSDWLILQDIIYLRSMNFTNNNASPYDAFINYMNILADFLQCLNELHPASMDTEEMNELLITIRNQEKEIVELRKKIEKKNKKEKKE